MIYEFAKGVCKYFVNKVLYRFNFKGLENIPEKDRLVICSNHVSLYDPVVIATQVKRPIHFLAKAELYKNSFISWIMRKVKTIPVDRGHVSIQTLKDAMSVLKKDNILGIFPEGTRVKEGEKKEPLDGFVVFALKTKSPILPVHIEGRFKFRAKINVTFGKPIYLNEYYGRKVKADEISEISKDIMNQIYSLE